MKRNTVLENTVSAPIARKKKHTHLKFGVRREDPYFWMHARNSKKVIEHLKKENAYCESHFKRLHTLEKKLFLELKSRLKETTSSFPYQKGEWSYWFRYVKGKQYPIYERKKTSGKSATQMLLNVNKEAAGHSYFDCGIPKLSLNEELIAFQVDFVGRRFYEVRFKNLATGKTLKQKISDVHEFVWANDNRHLYFVKPDPQTLRGYQVIRYDLVSGKTKIIFEEKDEAFRVHLQKALNDGKIWIHCQSTTTSEWHWLDANDAESEPICIQKRREGHEYMVDDGGDEFFVVTNWKAKDFRLMSGVYSQSSREHWKEIIPGKRGSFVEEVLVLKKHVVVQVKTQGLVQFVVIDRTSKKKFKVPMKGTSYAAGFSNNVDYFAHKFCYTFENLNCPISIFECDFTRSEAKKLWQKEVPNFQPHRYHTERVWAQARDGKKIPVSLLYKKNLKNRKPPLLIFGYGSYGFSMAPWFQPNVVSLVDRGFVIAIAHVRGGSELGREWYEGGKKKSKKNTFFDFIDVTESLIRKGRGEKGKVFALGGSAGGLLLGAVANLRPELYSGMIVKVPFVDVVTTMLDESIPLTTLEYEEWGNPNKKDFFKYMLSYSPYDNVRPQRYPTLFVTTGFHDSQVQYWEPAKWVAKLRENNLGENQILFHTELNAGHGGVSGRMEKLKEAARDLAFMVDLATNPSSGLSQSKAE